MTRARDDGWGEALRRTLENAVRAPYYRRRFGRAWRGVRSIDDLSRLPLLDKLTAIRHQRELVVGEAPPGFGVCSSGTTRLDVDLPPLNVLHSPEEADAIDDLPAFDAPEEPAPGWTLVSPAVTHGLPDLAPPGELQVPWMHDRNSLYMTEAVLSKPQPDGRKVFAWRVTAGALKVFTTWLLERGKDPASFGIRYIGTNSFRLSPFWRRVIEERYRAEVFDNYSLSEFCTPATECKACGWHHFGWPPIIFEVLDLVSGERVRRGTGRLVLTGVYPYVQKMPLVRYDTGDVVELGPRCKVERARGIRFIGRVRRGLVHRSGTRSEFLLNPCAVQDVLEEFPEAERSPHPCITLGFIKSREVGLPRWTAEWKDRGKKTARLSFEVRFDPMVFTARAREIESKVRGALVAHEPALRRALRAGHVALEITAHRPGSLTPPPDKYD